jgi:GGDEF domain-containing protein
MHTLRRLSGSHLPVAGALIPCLFAFVLAVALVVSGHALVGLAALAIGALVSVALLTLQASRLSEINRDRAVQLEAALAMDTFRDRQTGFGTTQLLKIDWGRQLARRQRRGERFSLARIEVREPGQQVDHLMRDVVIAVAAVLRDLVRADDAVYRLGPCRFGVLLAGSDHDGGLRFVERVTANLTVLDLPDGERIATQVKADVFDWTDGIESLALDDEHLNGPVGTTSADLMLARWAGQRGRSFERGAA